ncbi:choline kinase family protein [Marinomonas foliarum]|uniref:Phosphotransferase n=1 Tax=Marinomonas foliarum TaxID=491950 RepID=A0A369AFI7_9GAMM|nr:choline kinase family protein [Marinomonas foliarum]QRV24993.1 phosphotransferase [Marinomonas foliarum]RCX07913.1 thiamine kinase-like enzyme [Marinomonas foliarum]
MTELSEYFANLACILPSCDKIKTTSLEEGFSNEAYLIDWGHSARLVLRVPFIDSDIFYINRVNEVETLKSAAILGLSPAVLWHDQKGAVACQFVAQPSLDWSVAHVDKDIARIAQALAISHQDLPITNHQYAVFDVIEHYLSGIYSYIENDAVLLNEYEYLKSIVSQLLQPNPLLKPALCHNDLNPKNILMDNEQLWFIDWEYCGVGDPLFDLAVVAKSHNLDERQTMLLLAEYDVDLPFTAALEAISEYKKAYAVREMAWLLLKHLVTPEDSISLAYYYEFKAMPSLNPFCA